MMEKTPTKLDLSMPEFFSSRFNQPTEDSLFSYGYVLREVEEELLSQYEKEGPVVMEGVSLEGLREFLFIYFAPSVVEGILLNFLEMKNSGLGQEYFLRGGISMLGVRTLHDIREEFREFYSKYITITENIGRPVQAQDFDWTVVTRSKKNQIAQDIEEDSSTQGGSSVQGSSENDSSRSSDRGGRRRGGRRGRERINDYESGRNRGKDIIFLEVSIEEIVLPAFSISDKHILFSSEVRQTIGERSIFYNIQVHEYVQDTPDVRLYAPEFVQHEFVFLFHGMRHSSWSSFQKFRIRSRILLNEFSSFGAFYLTNSVRHAFEHPLHQHPRRNTTDFISVLVFIVHVLVLHGETVVPGGSDPFRIKWFEQVDAEWKDFCYNNLVVRRHPNHPYDIVIGPSCLPTGVGSVSELRIDGFAPTQIACCTDRARKWIVSTASTIYVEQRQPDENLPRDDDMGIPGMSSGPGGKGSYVPPIMRGGAKGNGESMQRGRDDNSIRVTNLSDDTREQDLHEMFRPFGAISHIYVAFDRETGLSRGFAFINFVHQYGCVHMLWFEVWCLK